MSNHTLINSGIAFASALLQYTAQCAAAVLPCMVLGSIHEALRDPGRLQGGIEYRNPRVPITVPNNNALALTRNAGLPPAPYEFRFGDANYHLMTFTETMSGLGDDLMSRALIPVVKFLANTLPKWKANLAINIVERVFDVGLHRDLAGIYRGYGYDYDSVRNTMTAIGVSMMGSAKLLGDDSSLLKISCDALGFMLLSFGHNTGYAGAGMAIGGTVIDTLIYAGALATRHMLDTFTQTTNVTASDFAVLGSAGQFFAFLGFKGPAIIGGTISPLIPALVVAATTRPMMYVKVNLYAALATACAGTLANSVADFYEVPADQVSVSGLPFGILVFTAAIAAPLLKPLHYPSYIRTDIRADIRADIGAAAKYSYVFFSSLALLDATARLGSVLFSIWFSSDESDGSTSGYDVGMDAEEVIAVDAEAAAAPIDDAHAGEL